MLGRAVLEFEQHLLAENFKSDFNLMRKGWRERLEMKKTFSTHPPHRRAESDESGGESGESTIHDCHAGFERSHR